jgi:ATP-dependent 26S proteasome regulatory subunit
MGTPNGILFYGPPGTGKTRLTEDLPELMGMNPISIGISSS